MRAATPLPWQGLRDPASRLQDPSRPGGARGRGPVSGRQGTPGRTVGVSLAGERRGLGLQGSLGAAEGRKVVRPGEVQGGLGA